MGYNLVLGCHTCRLRRFVYRGEEAEQLALFMKAHQRPAHRVAITDDQSDEAWANGPDWQYDDERG